MSANPFVDLFEAQAHEALAKSWLRLARMCAEIAADELGLAHEAADRAARGFRELGVEATADRAEDAALWKAIGAGIEKGRAA